MPAEAVPATFRGTLRSEPEAREPWKPPVKSIPSACLADPSIDAKDEQALDAWALRAREARKEEERKVRVQDLFEPPESTLAAIEEASPTSLSGASLNSGVKLVNDSLSFE